ncbi:peptidylprolyl isomerase [Flavobacteriaceae bacterium]|nr:peptidylprolyl isomerase [Flavobacteriaceae bacterium]
MHVKNIFLIFSFLILNSCKDIPNKPSKKIINKQVNKNKPKLKKEVFLLNDKNAIPFFFNYEKENKENQVRIVTDYGNIDIQLYKDTPYHRANFIFLTKKKYFDGEYFHRVVKDFIIQGGNSDNRSTSKKRRAIGKYLLPPDTKKGHKHHRGVVSMPSSEIENPYKLASPYEFFIVQKKDGAYHLDGDYTAFGKVIDGMSVVDKIANLKTDKREWPIENVRFKTLIIK